MTDTRNELPRFKLPEPMDMETYSNWHDRVGTEFERFVNEELVPALILNPDPDAPVAPFLGLKGVPPRLAVERMRDD